MTSTVTRPADTERPASPEVALFLEVTDLLASVFAFQAGYAAGQADTLKLMSDLSSPVPG